MWVRNLMEFMSVDAEGSRRKLWDSLIKLKQGFSKPWCLCKDFNEIRHIGERKDCSKRDGGMAELNEFIKNCEKKLKVLKLSLRKWNKEVYGSVPNKLKAVEKEVHNLDLQAKNRELDQQRKLEKEKLQKKYGDFIEWWNRLFEHFKKLYSEKWVLRPKLGGIFKLVQSSPHFEVLETKFSVAEILVAVKDCEGNKAPGPYGFNMLCFQKIWKVMKKEVLNFIKEFYRNGKLVKGFNSSFITLVPKKENPVGLTDYRPINLVGSVYKVLAKVLSRRLKEVLPCIISETQSTFIWGKKILDGVLIANEVADGWKKSKKWVEWIMECVSMARISVLVNGSPSEEFSPQRGLRQGDPLSPFLFNLVAERLNMLLTRAYQMEIIKRVIIGADDVMLSHLQFVDDSILFYEAQEEELKVGDESRVRFLLDKWCHTTYFREEFSGLFFSSLDKEVSLRAMYECTIAEGTGVEKSKVMNDCLLIKWWWRFGYEKDALWRKVICRKYKTDFSDWMPTSYTKTRVSSVWKGILNIVVSDSLILQFYLNNWQLKVGDESRVRFLLDKWCHATCFREEFSGLFFLSLDKEVSLRAMYERKGAAGNWMFNSRRRLYDWEDCEATRLKSLLGAAPTLVDDQLDRPVWSAVSTEVFLVSSVYNGVFAIASPPLRICKLVWVKYLPPRVQFLGWLAWKSRLKTTVFLQRIGVLRSNTLTLCVFYKAEIETVNHVMVSCLFASTVWTEMLNWWDVQGTLPRTVEGLLLWWDRERLSNKE
ncbi:uncharacterized protein LOC114316487 [Camellia sinensis]|uniref:uncharacterized protein LOC114316487 n=1 Tax=Camellia sinensis TaxID=4442 RepID=UPI0010357E91|nr:uncharacterized protein LOC114316487 [Camellia sinensis]